MVDRLETAKARQRWLHFTVAAPAQYQSLQVAAMAKHLSATPALDTIIVAAHDADGRPTFAVSTLERSKL